MKRRFRAIIQSKTELEDKQSIWLNEGFFRYYNNGEWEPIGMTKNDPNITALLLKEHISNKQNPHGVTKQQIGLSHVTDDAQVRRVEMGKPNGVASLDITGKVPIEQLPSGIGGGTSDLVLGETATTAYPGDKGKKNADDIAEANYQIAKLNEDRESLWDEVTQLRDNVGKPSGIAPLDEQGVIPSQFLPSYVDDVVEYTDITYFPTTGESGKIYIALDTNKTYRWGGTTYVEMTSSVALGETSATAYAGDKGKANRDDIDALKSSVSTISSNLEEVTETAETAYSASANLHRDFEDFKTIHGDFGSTRIKTLEDKMTVVEPKVDKIDSHVADNNNPHATTKSQVGLGNVTNDAQVKRTEMGANNGVATLNAEGKIPENQLPAGVISSLIIGETEGTAYDGAKGAKLKSYFDDLRSLPFIGYGGSDTFDDTGYSRVFTKIGYDPNSDTFKIIGSSLAFKIPVADPLKSTGCGLITNLDKKKFNSAVASGNNIAELNVKDPTNAGVEIELDYNNINPSNGVQSITARSEYIPVADKTKATGSGLMLNTDKAKLDGIAESANNYVLPAADNNVLGGIKAIKSTNITFNTLPENSTKYNTGLRINEDQQGVISVPYPNNATTTSSGLMSAEDKTKLDNSTEYVLPAAGKNILGGIKAVSDAVDVVDANSITTNGKTTAINTAHVLAPFVWNAAANSVMPQIVMPREVTANSYGLMSPEDKVKLDGLGGGDYTLPAARENTLGGIKANVGTYNVPKSISNCSIETANVYIDSSTNKLFAFYNYPYVATTTDDGLMSKIDKIKLDSLTEIELASPTKAGIIKVGSNNIEDLVNTTDSDLVPNYNNMLATYVVRTDSEGTAYVNVPITKTATTTKDGLLSKTDKAKLDNLNNIGTASSTTSGTIKVGDNTLGDTIILPTDPDEIVDYHNSVLYYKVRTDSGGTGYVNIPIPKTATTTKHGLMSKTDKLKLDSLNLLEPASPTVLGGVRAKVGDPDDAVDYTQPTVEYNYSRKLFVLERDYSNEIGFIPIPIPEIATTTKDGLMSSANLKQHNTLYSIARGNIISEVTGSVSDNTYSLTVTKKGINTNGVQTTTNSDITLPLASTTSCGLMPKEDKIKLDSLSNYTLPPATTSSLGGIKVGSGLTVAADGTLSSSVNLDLYQIVPSLDLVTHPSTNKIYLVQDNDAPLDSGNIYSEYIYVKDAFEKIGEYTASVDLSDHYNKGEINNKLAAYATKASVDEVNAKFNDYLTKTDATSTYATKTDLNSTELRVNEIEDFTNSFNDNYKQFLDASLTRPFVNTIKYNISNTNKNELSIFLKGKYGIIEESELVSSVTLPLATTTTCGLMSKEDKAVVNSFNSNGSFVSEVSVDSTYTQGIKLNVKSINTSDSNVVNEPITIPLATSTTNGLMSKDDRARLIKLGQDGWVSSITGTVNIDGIKITANNGLTSTLDSNYTIPIATIVAPGLITPTDYSNLQYLAEDSNNIITSFSGTNNADGSIKLKWYKALGTAKDSDLFTIPIATTTTAGLMSKDDKKTVDEAKSLMYSNQITSGLLILPEQDGSIKLTWNNDTLMQEGHSYIIPLATSSKAGLITPTQLSALNAVSGVTGNTNKYVNALSITKNTTNNNITFTWNSNTVTNGSQANSSFAIGLATTSEFGLMSSEDKTDIESLKSSVNSILGTDIYRPSSVTVYDTSIVLDFKKYNLSGTTVTAPDDYSGGTSLTLPSATTSKAGLLSKADKIKLDSLTSITIGTADGTAYEGSKGVALENSLQSLQMAQIDRPNTTGIAYGTTYVDLPFTTNTLDYISTAADEPSVGKSFNIHAATSTKAGVMSATDKAKLDSISVITNSQLTTALASIKF